MPRSLWITPLLLTAGLLPCACSDAVGLPAPHALGGAQVASATEGSSPTGGEAGSPAGSTSGETDGTAAGTSSETDMPQAGSVATNGDSPPQESMTGAPSSPTQTSSPIQATPMVFEAEDLELSGQYVESIATPFSGVALYANDDAVSLEYAFAAPGSYRVDVTAASSNNSTASVEVLLDTRSLGELTFRGTDAAAESLDFSIRSASPRTLTFSAINDDNTWDLFIDRIEITPIDATDVDPNASSSTPEGL